MSEETSKKSISKNKSLFKETNMNQNVNKQKKSISLNNLVLTTKKKFNINEPSKKVINVVDFIKQKKNFFIEDSFDIKGARKFLASREVAMRVIKLNDEIDFESKKQKEKFNTNKNLMKLDSISPKNKTKKHKSLKIAGKRTISPRKPRKKRNTFEKNAIEKKKKDIKQKSSKKKKEKITDNSSYIASKGDDVGEKKNKNSSNNDEIYKFFIDNANEPDDKFQIKLEKELRKVESHKKTKKNVKENNIKRKSQSKKDLELKIPKRMHNFIVPKSKETQSQFMFSEINKNMMKNDNLNISSIGEDEKCCTSPKKAIKNKVKRAYGSIQVNNMQFKERILKNMQNNIDDKEDNENEKGRVEIKSDKESLISILSDLM